MVDYWEKYYSRSLARKGKLSSEDCYCTAEHLKQLLLEQNLPLEGHVLVVGAGTSELPALLVEGAARVTAVDVSKTAIDWMRTVQPRVHWHLGDAAAMPASWINCFDCLIDKGLLAHKVADHLLASAAQSAQSQQSAEFVQSTLLREYLRVLKPGAYAVLASLSPLSLSLDSDGWVNSGRFQLGETFVHLVRRPPRPHRHGLTEEVPDEERLERLPSWVRGLSRSSSKVLVRTDSLSTSQRAKVDLQVSSESARIVTPWPPFEVLEIALPSEPLGAFWTKQGLELVLKDERIVTAPCAERSNPPFSQRLLWVAREGPKLKARQRPLRSPHGGGRSPVLGRGSFLRHF